MFVVSALLILSFPSLGFATPSNLGTKQAKARQVKAEIDQIDENLSIAVEEYNQAHLSLDQLREDIKENTTKLKKSRKELAKSRKILNKRARSIYMSGKVEFMEFMFDTTSFDELVHHFDFLKRIGERDAQLIGKISAEKREIEAREKRLVNQEKEQRKVLKRIDRKKEQIESQMGEKQELLAGIEEEIKALKKKEEAEARARYAEAQRREAAREAEESSSRQNESENSQNNQQSLVSSAPPIAAPSSKPNTSVIAIAYQQLGKPYRWGAAGPDAFDCSGLTMYVYAQIGVSLPHSSQAQYGVGEAISRTNLQPGDLVFFGSPIHHVGIYAGNGSMIHAPSTGDVVKVSSINSDYYSSHYVGARRP